MHPPALRRGRPVKFDLGSERFFVVMAATSAAMTT
jgi:hypothetical protein